MEKLYQVKDKITDFFWEKAYSIYIADTVSVPNQLLGYCIYIDRSGDRKKVKVSELPEKKPETKRLIVLSDIHARLDSLGVDGFVPSGDVLILAGDLALLASSFSDQYNRDYYEALNEWLKSQSHAQKLVIGGNHDIYLEKIGKENVRKLLSAATYLEDESFSCFGLKFWGSPISWGKSSNKAFQNKQDERLQKMETCDVLITHCHPEPHLEKLRQRIQEIKPRILVCGHIHGCYGSQLLGETLVVNASILNNKYRVRNLIQVIDIN